MRIPSLFASTVILCLAVGTAMAEESSLKGGAKKVGQETGTVVHKVGEESKELGKKVAETAREVGHATRDGAKEFVKAVKGEGNANSSKSSAPTHQHKSN